MTLQEPAALRLPPLVDNTWGVGRQRNLLIVRFRGHLTEQHGQASIRLAQSLMGDDPFHLIGDLLELERYDSGARVAWQEGLLPRKSRIRSIHIGSSNRIVSMGVTVFGMFLGLSIENCRSRTDLMRAAARCRHGNAG